jgi:hypothetical protein
MSTLKKENQALERRVVALEKRTNTIEEEILG